MFGVVVSGAHGRFPDLAFLHFSVSKHDENVIDFAGETLGQAHTQATGEGVTDGPGGEVDAGHFAHVRVIAQRAAQAGVFIEPFLREHPQVSQDRELTYGGVALAHQEAVAARPFRLFGTDRHHVVVQRREQFGGGKHRGVVAGLGDFDQADGFKANEFRPVLERLDGLGRRHEIAGFPLFELFAGCRHLYLQSQA
ncbi:hypothetical protein D3C73_479570 [compost metagenome]